MRKLVLLALAGALAAPEDLTAQAQAVHQDILREWEVEWGGRTRDPYVAPDGKVWFVGQAGNYVAYFDPATEDLRRYEIEEGTNPHTRIGKLDPATGELEIFPTGEARDPHTMVFDGRGNIWFTSQQSNMVGRLNMSTGEVDLIQAHEERGRPYGIVLDGEGNPWVSLFNTPYVIRIDPRTMEPTRFSKATPESRSRRIEWTPGGDQGHIWYVDEPRGYLGRIDPATGDVTEWQTPGGPGSRPYALTKDDRNRLWLSETGPEKQLVGFDPRTQEFFSVNEVSHNIRHMMFDQETGAMWFGTDANNVGRILAGRVSQ
jgi:virginiamycin B lyase